MKEKKWIKSIAQCCLPINTDEFNVLIDYALTYRQGRRQGICLGGANLQKCLATAA